MLKRLMLQLPVNSVELPVPTSGSELQLPVTVRPLNFRREINTNQY